MTRSLRARFLCLVPLAVAAGSVANQAPHAPSRQPPAVRNTLQVGFWTLWHDRQVQVTPAGAAAFRTCEHCPWIPLRAPLVVRAGSRELEFTPAQGSTPAKALFLNGPVKIDAHGESEQLSFPISVTARNGALVVAVTLPVESYVERVVASESGPLDNLESLKALAIAVRSYALHERHGHPDYDLCDSTHCQLLHWRGFPQRSSAAHRAALETAGETLWFQDQRAHAYFNKDCGGQSAAVNAVWPKAAPKAYLVDRPDPYCARTPPQQWTADLTRAQLTAALDRRGLVPPGWQHLAVDRRSQSGRVLTVRLDHTFISAEDFRIAVGETVGWSHVQSNWFEVSENGDHIYLHGRGSGHGVGLCQKGAAAMGAEGRSSDEILAQYFPRAYAADEATGARWRELKGTAFVLQTLDSNDAALLPEIERARLEASQRSGLNMNDSITVRAFASTTAFRDATLSPGWVAAFTERQWIATQPLRILAQRRLLAGILRHEFLHALIEKEAGPTAPLWLREGLVELWGAEPADQSALRLRAPTTSLDALEAALRDAQTEAGSEAAHREAALYCMQLLDRYDRDQVLSWVRSGLPASVAAQFRSR